MREVLKIRNLSKKLNDRLIINSLNVTIYEGDIFGLLGSNGSGKTTTIKLILGLIKCTSGEIYINGINAIENYKQAIRHIASVMEKPKFYKNLNAYDNLKLIKNFYKEIPESRILEVLQLVELDKNSNTKVESFSLDMRKRLEIASALIVNPKIILLDEPFNGLDNQEKTNLINLVKFLANEKKIAFFVCSHIFGEIESVFNRAAIINNGVIKIQGEISELLNTRKNTYEFIVDDKDKSKDIIKSIKGAFIKRVTNKGLLVELVDNESWEINKELNFNNIKVFEINKVNKNLYDDFI